MPINCRSHANRIARLIALPAVMAAFILSGQAPAVAGQQSRLAGAAPAGLRAVATLTSPYDNIFNNGFEDPCTEDADRDGLADCVETNTGVYVSASDTGTDPHNPDTDGDGLLDGEEVNGTAAGLDLPALGVNPLHRDILLEYDWFDDAVSCAQHSHQPTPEIIQQVHDFFANAPVTNPDGTTGINVIQDFGQGGVFTGGNLIAGDGQLYGTVFGTQYQSYEAANFAANRHGYFHYILMAHTYDDTTGNTGSSGYAAIPGYEVMVTLACTVTASYGANFVRNAIAHELGHNLGLDHGGDTQCNYKPNYSSVMNYRYEFSGIDTTCIGNGDPSGNASLDYSHGDRLTLDENNLDETLGMCTTSTVPVDWNGNGQYEISVTADINAYSDETSECGGSLYTVLHDYDDWGHLDLSAVSPSSGSRGAGASPETKLSLPARKRGVGCAPIPKPKRGR